MKAVLTMVNPSEKHAWWWLKVFGSGIRNLEIKYHDNTKADSLSRNPVLLYVQMKNMWMRMLQYGATSDKGSSR